MAFVSELHPSALLLAGKRGWHRVAQCRFSHVICLLHALRRVSIVYLEMDQRCLFVCMSVCLSLFSLYRTDILPTDGPVSARRQFSWRAFQSKIRNLCQLWNVPPDKRFILNANLALMLPKSFTPWTRFMLRLRGDILAEYTTGNTLQVCKQLGVRSN